MVSPGSRANHGPWMPAYGSIEPSFSAFDGRILPNADATAPAEGVRVRPAPITE
jgi:hypothetical protein